jgi:hypothetical protein
MKLLRNSRWVACAGTLVATSLALAQPPGSTTDLPPVEHVAAAIEQHPSVAGARAGITLEEANRRRLNAGLWRSGGWSHGEFNRAAAR